VKRTRGHEGHDERHGAQCQRLNDVDRQRDGHVGRRLLGLRDGLELTNRLNSGHRHGRGERQNGQRHRREDERRGQMAAVIEAHEQPVAANHEQPHNSRDHSRLDNAIAPATSS
jgi:hypothetical protein